MKIRDVWKLVLNKNAKAQGILYIPICRHKFPLGSTIWTHYIVAVSSSK